MTGKPKDAGNQELELLLPWYVNGTLDAGTRRRIDEALARDGRLRRSLELAREDRDAALHIGDRIGAPSAEPLRKIMRTVENSGRAAAFAFKQSLAGRFKIFVDSLSPRVLAAAALAAVLALAIQAGTIGLLSIGRDAGTDLELASGGDEPRGATATFIVGFVPGVTMERVTGLLRELDLGIVEGPAGGGLYVVEVPLSEETGPGGEKVLLRLQARSDIVAFSAKAPTKGD